MPGAYFSAAKGSDANGLGQEASAERLKMTATIVSAFLSANKVSTSELLGVISNVYLALSNLGSTSPEPEKVLTPAVSIRSSIKPDYLVCLEDGKRLKMLKRYLMTRYSMTPDEYRAKWNLPSDYPMVAPNYAETRRTLAVQIGLGRGSAGRSKK